MAWDEENRLMALSDNGKTSRYTYNATSGGTHNPVGGGTTKLDSTFIPDRKTIREQMER